jgi:hypothetical protein
VFSPYFYLLFYQVDLGLVSHMAPSNLPRSVTSLLEAERISVPRNWEAGDK